MSELQEATKEFLVESHENLDQLDTDLLGLEKAAAPADALGRIFRTLHTIKGSCSFLGFPNLEAVAHAGESLLGKLRDGRRSLSPDVTEALLSMVDVIRRMLARIETAGGDEGVTAADVIDRLHRLTDDAEWSASKTFVAGDVPTDDAPSASDLEFVVTTDDADFDTDAAPEPVVDVAPATAPAPVERASASLAIAPSDGGNTIALDGSAIYDASVRIGVELLDRLMTIASEIVLARNQILQYSHRHGDPAFQNTCRQLNLITTELQEYVMKTRLQPLGNVWSRFPRLVHDTAQACGKKVRLEIEGSETELDKAMLEAIRDPLTHLVRNAVDHGVESPERRRAAGKPAEGRVSLRAYHEGGQVNVEVSDDGGGIDPERVRQRAIDQRLISAEQAARMSTATILGLIFMPGLSTAPTVTTLSGRGVGMDVVKTNIEKIGGSVDVQSAPGRGTTVRLRIPLTLAIIKVLVVTSAGDRYAIPQVSIVELVRVEGDKLRKAIQRVHDVLVYRYRGRLLPLVNLNRALRVDGGENGAEAVNIVVLQAADRQFGLVIDEINDTQEIVVKPLWKHLKGLACFAGATVMGDGRVALILDVFGLAQQANAFAESQEWAAAEAQDAAAAPVERPGVLLVQGRDRGRLAIPLGKVARLEEFPPTRLERVAGKQVVQYRGQIMHLLDVDATLNPMAAERGGADGAVQVVVCARPDRPVGLIVERILDVVERDSDVLGPASRAGVECTAVIQGHVTEVLDVDALLRAAAEV